MAEENEKPQEEKKEPEKGGEKKSGSNMPLIAGIIAGVLILEALMLFFFLQMTKPPSSDEVDAKMKADSLKETISEQTTAGAVTEEPIEAVVNIAGTDGMRFLKVVLVLEFDDKEYKKLGEELIRRHAKMKNLLIEQLSAMTLEEANDPEAQIQIRKEFMRKVNNTLPEKTGQISNVYLNEYIVQ